MSEFTHSPSLFISEDGQRMYFYIRPGPVKKEIRPLIEHGGGVLTSLFVQSSKTIRLVSKNAPFALSPGDVAYYSDYIQACVESNTRLDIEDFRVKGQDEDQISDISDSEAEPALKTRSSARRVRDARREYTHEDNVNILKYISESKRYREVKGTLLWKDLEKAMNRTHTWQSLKERFIKRIYPDLDMYDLSENEIERFRAGFNKTGDDPPPKSNQKFYSKEEDQKILDYILNHNLVFMVSGNSIWAEMEWKKILGRTRQSMKERFRKHILPNISKYNIVNPSSAFMFDDLTIEGRNYLRELKEKQKAESAAQKKMSEPAKESNSSCTNSIETEVSETDKTDTENCEQTSPKNIAAKKGHSNLGNEASSSTTCKTTFRNNNTGNKEPANTSGDERSVSSGFENDGGECTPSKKHSSLKYGVCDKQCEAAKKIKGSEAKEVTSQETVFDCSPIVILSHLSATPDFEVENVEVNSLENNKENGVSSQSHTNLKTDTDRTQNVVTDRKKHMDTEILKSQETLPGCEPVVVLNRLPLNMKLLKMYTDDGDENISIKSAFERSEISSIQSIADDKDRKSSQERNCKKTASSCSPVVDFLNNSLEDASSKRLLNVKPGVSKRQKKETCVATETAACRETELDRYPLVVLNRLPLHVDSQKGSSETVVYTPDSTTRWSETDESISLSEVCPSLPFSSQTNTIPETQESAQCSQETNVSLLHGSQPTHCSRSLSQLPSILRDMMQTLNDVIDSCKDGTYNLNRNRQDVVSQLSCVKQNIEEALLCIGSAKAYATPAEQCTLQDKKKLLQHYLLSFHQQDQCHAL